MRYIKLPVAVMAVVLSFALALHAEEVKSDTAAPGAPAEVKKDVSPEATPAIQPETKPEAAPAAKEEEKPASHDHPFKEKRFVATAGLDGVQHVEIAGGEFYFDPNYIVVKVNVPVEMEVRAPKDSSWFIPHDIVVKAPEVGIDFSVNFTKKGSLIKFTPTKVGKYPMYCDKKPPFGKSHKDKGMDGFIEVVP